MKLVGEFFFAIILGRLDFCYSNGLLIETEMEISVRDILCFRKIALWYKLLGRRKH